MERLRLIGLQDVAWNKTNYKRKNRVFAADLILFQVVIIE